MIYTGLCCYADDHVEVIVQQGAVDAVVPLLALADKDAQLQLR